MGGGGGAGMGAGGAGGARGRGARARARGAVRAVVTDVDGTLLDPRNALPASAARAARELRARGIPLILATGKTRGPWLPPLLEAIGPLGAPALFAQGLLAYEADGTPLWERALEPAFLRRCVRLARRLRDVQVVAYCGSRLVCAACDRHSARLPDYGEPEPEAVGDLEEALCGGGGRAPVACQKLIFMADEPMAGVRAELARELRDGEDCSLTSALPGMLEVLPVGASKGEAVARLLRDLGIRPEEVVALGDGENDVELLELAGVGVAMGNASPAAVRAAQHQVAANDADGWAEAVDRFVLEGGRSG